MDKEELELYDTIEPINWRCICMKKWGRHHFPCPEGQWLYISNGQYIDISPELFLLKSPLQ
jgi:hypothetical protein